MKWTVFVVLGLMCSAGTALYLGNADDALVWAVLAVAAAVVSLHQR